jgi:hypothetical protein
MSFTSSEKIAYRTGAYDSHGAGSKVPYSHMGLPKVLEKLGIKSAREGFSAKFTAPMSGVYAITARVSISVNGSTVALGNSLSIVHKLYAGDVVTTPFALGVHKV